MSELLVTMTKAEFEERIEKAWARLEFKYRRQPLQLSWVVPGKRGAA